MCNYVLAIIIVGSNINTRSLSLSLSLSLHAFLSPLLSFSLSLSPSLSLPFSLSLRLPPSLSLQTQHTQWKSDAIESIRKYMEVRLQLDELRDEKESEIRELKYRLDHRPATRRPSDSRYCACNGWKVACFILLVMVLLLVVVLVAVIALQVTAPQVRPI